VAYIENHRGEKPVHDGKIKTTKAAITKLHRASLAEKRLANELFYQVK